MSCKPNHPICSEEEGSLPSCGPLAVAFVAEQKPESAVFSEENALKHGTLYPNLDLPFHLKVNPGEIAGTPLNQLRALEFVVLELGLYLDTHPFDREAFSLFRKYAEMEKTAKEAYVSQNSPLLSCDAARDNTYTWVNGPWPWQYQEEVK